MGYCGKYLNTLWGCILAASLSIELRFRQAKWVQEWDISTGATDRVYADVPFLQSIMRSCRAYDGGSPERW
jgi:hypothetical protein